MAADDLRKAMRRAFHLGQTYWMHADSESFIQNQKADSVQAKFNELVEETVAASPTAAPKEETEPTLSVLNALDVLERMGYDAEHIATAATFLMVLGERGMWVIENPLTTRPIAADTQGDAK